MKFSIPIGIALLNELIEKNSSVSFDFVITTDEEVGGFEGAGFLAQEIKWRPHCIIVPDGGDNVQFVTASKGVAQFKITMFGTSAHASRPWEGDNALPKIAQVIIELEKRYKRNNSKKEWETTLNFGQISGGISTNQVCDQAELKIDFRYPETDTFERIKAEVATLVTAIDTKGLVEELSIGLPTFTDSNESIVQEFIKCLSDAYQQEISVKPTYGASDARHFASYGIPILMSKPHGGDIHMESEWLDVDSTMTFYKAVHSFVKSRRS